ncbi:hypothetical protein H4219_003939 [Mycoemilia scoparia]|uniref:Uncharacterized protein n=1 Tax=Mycoemilia scoparia TaxID=417184 RepID=A0A9W7ZZV4_9FUNG|nr:hypothetical protein H4219_003939 [Mycoemilia scoparia]
MMLRNLALTAVAATLTFTTTFGATARNPTTCNEKSFIVFGDSASDTGNKKAIFNSQELSFYWKGRYSNGPVWNEYTAYLLGMPLVNYAIGGATSSNSALVNGTENGQLIPSFLDQINHYLQNTTSASTGKSLVEHPERSIVTLEIGGNNFMQPMLTDPNYLFTNKDRLIEGLVKDIMAGLQTTYNAGYRRFVICDAFPLYYAPVFNGNPQLVSFFKQIGADTNVKLVKAVKDFRIKYKADSIFLFNSANLFELIHDPRVISAINVTDTTSACFSGANSGENAGICSNGEQYLYYDPAHGALRNHFIIGAAVARFIMNPHKGLTVNDLVEAAQKYRVGQATAEKNILAAAGIHNGPQYPSRN